MNFISEFLEKNQDFHHIEFTAEENLVGKRIDAAVPEVFPEVTRSSLKNVAHIVSVNGFEHKLSYKIKLSDTIAVYWQKTPEISFGAEKVDFQIIYKDDDIMVIDKPWGLVVHPAKGHQTGTLANGILHYLQEENINDEFGEEGRVGIVHRLDKDTRGLMLIALNEESSRNLVEAFKNRQVTKIYKAIVKGHMPEHGVIEGAIGRSSYDRKKMAVLKTGGKEARTDYKVLQHLKEHSLVACKLFTGRTHQIRVHLSHLGYPIINDELYSRQRDSQLPGMALIACHLAFAHPKTGKEMSFTLPDPIEFTQCIEQLV